MNPLCERCARQLRLEIVRAIGRHNVVALQDSAYIAGSGRLWFWHAPNYLVVDASILAQVEGWLPRVKAPWWLPAPTRTFSWR